MLDFGKVHYQCLSIKRFVLLSAWTGPVQKALRKEMSSYLLSLHIFSAFPFLMLHVSISEEGSLPKIT